MLRPLFNASDSFSSTINCFIVSLFQCLIAYFILTTMSYTRSPEQMTETIGGTISKSTSYIHETSRPSGIRSFNTRRIAFGLRSRTARIDALNPAGFLERNILTFFRSISTSSCLPNAGLKSESVFSVSSFEIPAAAPARYAAYKLYREYKPGRWDFMFIFATGGRLKPHLSHLHIPKWEKYIPS